MAKERFPAYDPSRDVKFMTYIHKSITDVLLRFRMGEEYHLCLRHTTLFTSYIVLNKICPSDEKHSSALKKRVKKQKK